MRILLTYFDSLPPTIFSSPLQFKKDTSGRNLVTRRQFFKGLSSLHIFLNLRDQGALWRTLDINFDNRLQYTEFALLFSPSELRDSVSAMAPPHVADDAESRFKSPRKEVDTASTLREVARQIRSVAYVGGEGSAGGGLDLTALFKRMHYHTGDRVRDRSGAAPESEASDAAKRLDFHSFRR